MLGKNKMKEENGVDERTERSLAIDSALRIPCKDDEYLKLLVGKLLSAVDATLLLSTWMRMCLDENEIKTEKECRRMWRSIGGPKHFATGARIVFLPCGSLSEYCSEKSLEYINYSRDSLNDSVGSCRSSNGTKYIDIRLGDWIKTKHSRFWLRVAAIHPKSSQLLCDQKNMLEVITKVKIKVEIYELWGAKRKRYNQNQESEMIIIPKQSPFRRKAALAKLQQLIPCTASNATHLVRCDAFSFRHLHSEPHSVSLGWERPQDDPEDRYQVEVYDIEFDAWVKVYAGNAHTTTISDLRPATTYEFRLCLPINSTTKKYCIASATTSQLEPEPSPSIEKNQGTNLDEIQSCHPGSIELPTDPSPPRTVAFSHDALKNEWIVGWCTKYQRYYYFNKLTKCSRWIPPSLHSGPKSSPLKSTFSDLTSFEHSWFRSSSSVESDTSLFTTGHSHETNANTETEAGDSSNFAANKLN